MTDSHRRSFGHWVRKKNCSMLFTVCDPVSTLQFGYFDWQQIFTFPKYDYVSEWFPFFLTAQHFAKIGVFLGVTKRSSTKGGENCVTPQ